MRRLAPAALLGVLYVSGCNGPPGGTPPHWGPEDVPVRVTEDGFVYVPARIGEGPALELFFDSGAPESVIDARAVAACPSAGPEGHTHVLGRTIGVRPVRVPVLRIGGVEVRDLRVWAADLAREVDLLPAGVSGILGGELLLRFILALNFPGRRLMILEPSRFRPRAGVPSTPLTLRRRLPFVTGWINRREVELLVDTGANQSLAVTSETALRIGIPIPSGGEAVPIRGIQGTAAAIWSRADEFRVGTLTSRAAPVLIVPAESHGPGIDGVLGATSFLRLTVIFDVPGGRLFLLPEGQ